MIPAIDKAPIISSAMSISRRIEERMKKPTPGSRSPLETAIAFLPTFHRSSISIRTNRTTSAKVMATKTQASYLELDKSS